MVSADFAQRAGAPGNFLRVVRNHPIAVRLFLHGGVFAAQQHQPVGMRVGQGIDQHGFDGREDHRGGAYADGDR